MAATQTLISFPTMHGFVNDYYRSELTVYGYIHQIQKLLLNEVVISDDTKNICCNLYHIWYEYGDDFNINDVLIIQKCIGRGKTASVHYASYKEYEIALKEYTFIELTDKILSDYKRELKLLQKLQHPNITLLIGNYINMESNKLYLAMEWIPNGHLYDLLFFSRNKYISFIDKLKMLIDIARGMEYIHNQMIIHCDLKLHNLLLDKQNRIKITDFGFSIQLKTINQRIMDHNKIVYGGYMAPELFIKYNDHGTVINFNGFDRKIDVFNFGVILWEIYERKNGFDQRCFRYIKELKNGNRPNISEQCPIKYKNLIIKCWATDSKQRPDFHQILSELIIIYKQNSSL